MSSELKTCPFCGGRAKVFDGKNAFEDYECGVSCPCGATISFLCDSFPHDTDADKNARLQGAIAAWNTRAFDATPAQAVKVKPLEWSKLGYAGTYLVKDAYGQGPKKFIVSCAPKLIGYADTEEEGRRIANDHNRTRILSGLEPAPDLSAIRAEEKRKSFEGFMTVIRELREEDDTEYPVNSERKAGWHAAVNAVEEALRALATEGK